MVVFRWVLLRMKIFQTKILDKIKTRNLCSKHLFRKSCRLLDKVGKIWYSRTGHRWHNIIWCTRFTYCITKTTHINSEYVIPIFFFFFHDKNCCTNAPQNVMLYVHCLSSVILVILVSKSYRNQMHSAAAWHSYVMCLVVCGKLEAFSILAVIRN